MRNVFPFLQQGVSSELKSIFELLETTEIEGRSKYGVRGHQKLMTLVVSRNYSKALLELCYLLVMVFGRAPGEKPMQQYYHFFFGIAPATSNQYRYHFLQDGAGEEDSEACHTVEVEGGVFSIYFSRMPVLVELMELLVTLLDFREVEEMIRPLMVAGSINKGEISLVTNALSAAFYQAMERHLPTAQHQRKFQQLARFLSEQNPGGFRYHQIGDREVLSFWRAFNKQEDSSGEDFVKFSSVLDAFMDFYLTSRLVAEIEQQGEWSSFDELTERQLAEDLVVDMTEDEEPLLERLTESPLNQVKFLNKRELEQLQWLFSSQQSVVSHFWLSCLRCRLFGGLQNRLIEQVRRGREVSVLFEEDLGGYQPLFEQDRKLEGLLERVMLASLYPLMVQGGQSILQQVDSEIFVF